MIGQSSGGTLPIGFSLDATVLLFAVGLSVVTAVALGLVAGFQ
jgi:hypothetical protein